MILRVFINKDVLCTAENNEKLDNIVMYIIGKGICGIPSLFLCKEQGFSKKQIFAALHRPFLSELRLYVLQFICLLSYKLGFFPSSVCRALISQPSTKCRFLVLFVWWITRKLGQMDVVVQRMSTDALGMEIIILFIFIFLCTKLLWAKIFSPVVSIWFVSLIKLYYSN